MFCCSFFFFPLFSKGPIKLDKSDPLPISVRRQRRSLSFLHLSFIFFKVLISLKKKKKKKKGIARQLSATLEQTNKKFCDAHKCPSLLSILEHINIIKFNSN